MQIPCMNFTKTTKTKAMSDINCPYCDKEQEINHDDGYGYEEGVFHNQECGHCGKTFVYKTSISFYYDPKKADCLNGDDHNYKPTKTWPVEFTKMECMDCGDIRNLTESEWQQLKTQQHGTDTNTI